MKTIIFGCGQYGKKALGFLSVDHEVTGFCDNNESLWNSCVEGKTVYPPDYLRNKNLMVVIAIPSGFKPVIDQVKAYGIKIVFVIHLYYASHSLEFRYRLFDVSDTNKIYSDQDKGDILKHSKLIINDKNDNSRKKILFISYLFPPATAGGVMRPLKFVKYLKEFGYDSLVLTSGTVDYLKFDIDTSLLQETKNIDIGFVDDNPIMPDLISNKEREEVLHLYSETAQSGDFDRKYKESVSAGNRELIPDEEIIWVVRCLNYIKAGLDMSEFDLVITTSSPYATLFAGYFIKKEYNIGWVADMRDPWCENDYINSTYGSERNSTRHIERILEKELLSSADMILVPSKCMIDDIKKFGINTETVCLTNGYDEQDFSSLEHIEFDKFTLCYNGTLYGTRDPFLLLNLLNEMIDNGELDSDSVQWIINGNVSGNIKRLLLERDHNKILILNGTVSHKKSLSIAASSDMLISFGEYGEGAYLVWTGKIFEYFRTCVPILSFSSHFGVQHDALMELKQGMTALPDETEQIKSFIKELFSDWKKNKKRKWGDIKLAQKYDRKNIAKKLAEGIDQLLINRGNV